MKENYIENNFTNKNEEKSKTIEVEKLGDQKFELEQNEKIFTAQQVFKNEFDILPSDNEQIIDKKVEKVIESPSFLEKIRNNSLLRNALKTLVVIFSLIRAESAFAQTKSEVEEKKTINMEYFEEVKNLYEKNCQLIKNGEYVVPNKVMVVFGEVVDPGMIGTPAGGYFKKTI